MIKDFILKVIGILIKQIFLFLGPIYIKLGQIFSYDYPILKQLYSLQNKCPDIKITELKEIQNKYSNLNISDKSIACGSIAVVHTGVYKDKKIAVKIKRPNIEKTISNSIWYTNIMLNLINKLSFFNFINMKARMKTVIKEYQMQTNFIREVNNWKLFYKVNKNSSNIITPFFFEDLCNDEIIVMEYLEGNYINDKKYKHLPEKDKVKIGNSIVGSYLSGLLNGVVHGDLHSGNVAYTEDFDLIIYDYGIIIKLSEYERNGIMNILNGLFKKNLKYTIDNFIKYFIVNKKNINNIYNDTLFQDDLFEINKKADIIELFFKVKKLIESNNLLFNDKMIMFELSLLPVNSTINNLNINKSIDYLLDSLINDVSNSILEL